MVTARGNVTKIGSQRMQRRKMVPVLKITIALIICSIFVECRKVKVFCVICKAYKSQIIHNFVRFVVHEWYYFVFWLARGHVKLRWGSVSQLQNSSIKILDNWKKISSCKLGASTKRLTLEMCNLSAVILLVITFQRCPILTTSVQTKCNALVLRLIK